MFTIRKAKIKQFLKNRNAIILKNYSFIIKDIIILLLLFFLENLGAWKTMTKVLL